MRFRSGRQCAAFDRALRAWLRLGWTLSHGSALALIYGATVTVWLTGVVAPLVDLYRRLQFPAVCPQPATCAADVWGAEVLIAFGIAATVTVGAACWVSWRRKNQKDAIRKLADEAMEYLKRFPDSKAAIGEECFLDLCIRLAGKEPNVGARDKMRRRAEFHFQSAGAARYLPPQTDSQYSAYLIASLCDLPPRWILDWESGRRD